MVIFGKSVIFWKQGYLEKMTKCQKMDKNSKFWIYVFFASFVDLHIRKGWIFI